MQLEIQRKEIISQQDYLETRDGMLQVLGRERVHKNLGGRSLLMMVLVSGWAVQF